MDWIREFQHSIDYMEEHIREELDYDEVGAIMHLSGFYYQKIFSIMCGLSLKEYIRNRRLALAGSELVSTDIRIVDLAMKYGYETQEGFTRAFTRFHGDTPGAVRKKKLPIKSFSKLSISIMMKGGESMDYKIEEKEGFTVIAKTQRFVKLEDVDGRGDIPSFWDACQKDGTIDFLERYGKKDGILGASLIGMCMEDSTVTKDFPYSIGTQYDGKGVPEGYKLYEIPAATWIVFPVKGVMPDAIQKTWHKIFAEFFPASDYIPAGNYDFEVYPFGDMGKEDYLSQIWIAVKKK